VHCTVTGDSYGDEWWGKTKRMNGSLKHIAPTECAVRPANTSMVDIIVKSDVCKQMLLINSPIIETSINFSLITWLVIEKITVN